MLHFGLTLDNSNFTLTKPSDILQQVIRVKSLHVLNEVYLTTYSPLYFSHMTIYRLLLFICKTSRYILSLLYFSIFVIRFVTFSPPFSRISLQVSMGCYP